MLHTDRDVRKNKQKTKICDFFIHFSSKSGISTSDQAKVSAKLSATLLQILTLHTSIELSGSI